MALAIFIDIKIFNSINTDEKIKKFPFSEKTQAFGRGAMPTLLGALIFYD
jgi:hypothetical protein